VVFMPGKFVFPGGRVDKADNRVPVAASIPKELEANLQKGSPKINAARAKSLAIAAIREACEETGLCLGRKREGKGLSADLMDHGSRFPVRGCCPIRPDCS